MVQMTNRGGLVEASYYDKSAEISGDFVTTYQDSLDLNYITETIRKHL